MLEGIGAIRSVGIHHRRSPGQLILTLMMVRHHHIHTDGGGKIHLLHAGDTAIHSDHQVNAPVVQGTHGVHGEAIAILDAAGDIVTDPSAAAAQIIHQDGGGGDAIHVIVAENGDMLATLQGAADTADGSVHVLHQEGGKGEGILYAQEIRSGGAVHNAVGGQHRRQQSRVAGLLQRGCRGGRGREVPFFKFHARLTSSHGRQGKLW